MFITSLNEGPKAEYSLDGAVLTVQGVYIDLAARQRDVRTVIDISLCNDLTTAAEGAGPWYIATVVIPPREYELVETGEIDEKGSPAMQQVVRPLDLSKVELRLWALPRSGQKVATEGVV